MAHKVHIEKDEFYPFFFINTNGTPDFYQNSVVEISEEDLQRFKEYDVGFRECQKWLKTLYQKQPVIK